ncbi:MAG: TatD family hydrolase [Alphaproteobacteria bacterium]|nr:TatD family hydrolase [Alphaproteobacteria bacterium]
MLIDSHCHLDFPVLAKDRANVLDRARRAGVKRLVNVCTRSTEFDMLRTSVEKYSEVFCTLGVHPHHVAEEGQDIPFEEFVKVTGHPKVIGIGETGLDYFYDKSPRIIQQQSFRKHVRAAQKASLPLVVHSRDAEEDTLRILKEEGAAQGVLHCFSSRRFLAEEGLKLGFYISLSGILTFKKSADLRAIVKDLPIDRLLIETDSPFLAPEGYRGKPCEPSYIVKTAEVLAEIKGVSVEEIARKTTENFFRLFTKCPAGDFS